eukprot:6765024-Prymnesium_polylepis.1
MRGGGGGVSAEAKRKPVGEDGGSGRKTTPPSSKATFVSAGSVATNGVGCRACRGVEGRGPRAAGRGATPKARSLGRS